MISTEQFLALLEEKDLLSARAVASLRAQVAQSSKPISAEAIAKRLIKHGHLTPALAKRLLSGGGEAPAKPAPVKAAPAKAAPPKAESDIGFAPLEEEASKPARSKPSAAKPAVKPAQKPEKSRPQPKRASVEPAAAESIIEDEIPVLAETDNGSNGSFLPDAALATAADTGSFAAAPARRGLGRFFQRKPKEKKEPQAESEQWGSMLMLGGGGLLLFLIIAGVALLYIIHSKGVGDLLKQADQEYGNQSYLQAITRYKDFLDKVSPSNEHASLARVHMGICELQLATSSPSSNWSEALNVTKDVLQRISGETDFKEAHGELAAMLPKIAEGLAEDAYKQTDRKRLEQTRETLKLIDKYVPRDKRPTARLDNVVQKLGITERNILRGDKLGETIAAMEKATKEAKTADAYAACAALVRLYPDIETDPGLKKAVLDVSLAQQTLVKPVSVRKGAAELKQAEATAVKSEITLAQRTNKGNVPDATGQVVLAAVDGTIYGLDAATGKVVWRRFIGFESNPQSPSFSALAFSTEPGSDALAVDRARHDVLRVNGTSGQLQWRHAVGEPFDAQPVIADEKIYIATRSGKVITVDAGSGESRGYIQLPQLLSVAPAVDKRRGVIYQIADHSNLFVLTADGACKQVFYLGHEPGAIRTRPLVVDDYLLVAVNTGADKCVFRVLAIQPRKSDKPDPWFKLVQEVALEGYISIPPLIDGRRVMLTTTAGVVRVFDLSGASEDKAPLRDIAETTIETGDNLLRFPLLSGGQLWIADTKLTKYDVQAAAGHMVPKILSEGGACLQAPVALGQGIVSVRRDRGMPGAVVSAIGTDDPPQSYWETRIASPLAGEPLPLGQGGKAVAVTANGAIYSIEAVRAEGSSVREPDAAPDAVRVTRPFCHLVTFPGGLVAMASGKGTNQVSIFDTNNLSAEKIRWPDLPDKFVLTCPPISLGKGLLVAGKDGQICLIDPQSGTAMAEPFQPRLEPGGHVDWVAPAAIDDRQVVAADGKTKIYCLRLQDEPKPHLDIVAETGIAKPITSPLAALGEIVFGCDSGKLLTAFAIPKFTRAREQVLGGQCAWGPARIGDRVLLSTDDGQLLCFDAKGGLAWSSKLKYGPLAGPPLRRGDDYVLASRTGTIWSLDAAGGKEREKQRIETGLPLATGPVLAGQQLLVGGHDGTLYELRQP